MKLPIRIYEHWKGDYPLFGFLWNKKTASNCPFGRYEKNNWCKTGFRLMFGHPEKHLVVEWEDDLFWCPLKKDGCK